MNCPEKICERPGFSIYNYHKQKILQYHFTSGLKNCKVTLFLKGPEVSGSNGDPWSLWKRLTNNYKNMPPLVAPRQVHGTQVLTAGDETCLPLRPEGDGVLIRDSKIRGSLRFADCFPIIIAFEYPEPGIMILHSGFRGTLKNIAGHSISLLVKDLGEKVLTNSHVFIGPGIGKCCYFRNYHDTVTREALNSFPQEYMSRDKERIFFDLGNIIKLQLSEAKLDPDNITLIPFCTSCRKDIMYSYRQGDLLDRMFLLAEIKDPTYQKSSFWWDNIL